MTPTRLVTLDFETYYARNYSLRKLTTEDYIRSPQFQAIGLGYMVDDGTPQWVTGPDIADALASLDLANAMVLAHNTAFDGAILNWHYGIRPKFLFDTLSMARPLHRASVGGSLAALATHYGLGEKGTEVVDAMGLHLEDFTEQNLKSYGAYCINDVVLTRKLFSKLRPFFIGGELLAIDLTLRMFTEPTIRLNTNRLQAYAAEHIARKAAVIKATRLSKTQLMSNPQFAEVLESYGQEAPTKVSLTTGKETFAFAKTDQGMQDLVNSDRPIIAALAKARLAVKSTIAETRAESLAQVAGRGALPVMLNYYGAHTGRFSGGDKLNLQNFPKRGGDVELRASLCAPPDHLILACDLSQIEARVVSWLAGEQAMVDLFANKQDVYSHFAAQAFGIDVQNVTKDQRFVGKTCILGLGYGMGAPKLVDTFRIMAGRVETLAQCQTYVSTYREVYPAIPRLWTNFQKIIEAMASGHSSTLQSTTAHSAAADRVPNILNFHEASNSIILPNGLPITYSDLVSHKKKGEVFTQYAYASKKAQLGKPIEDKTNIYGGKVVENVVQALAALIIRWQMTEIYKNVGIRPTFQVHDELVYVVPKKLAGYYGIGITKGMRTVPEHFAGLPVDCELSVGVNYGELRELTA